MFLKELSTPKGLLIFSKEPFEDKKQSFLCKKIKIPCLLEIQNDNFVFTELPSINQETIFVKL